MTPWRVGVARARSDLNKTSNNKPQHYYQCFFVDNDDNDNKNDEVFEFSLTKLKLKRNKNQW